MSYIPAVKEDSAVGLACGAYLAGRRPVVIMQNSGLGYSLNAFTSLAMIYEFPILILISWRGYQGKDAPQHLIIGGHLLSVLDAVGIPHLILEAETWREAFESAQSLLVQTQKPVAVIVRKGIIS